MNKRLFGGLIVVGALTLWSSVGVLAEDEEGLGGPGSVQAAAAVASLATDPACNPDLTALAALPTKDPQRAQELIDGLSEQIAQIKADTKEQILTALEQYQELFREARDGEEEDGVLTTNPTLPDFAVMATAACQQIQNVFNQTKATIQSLPAPTVTGERDDESEHDTSTVGSSGERD